MPSLKDRLREKRDQLSSDHATRLHRAISWLACAETHKEDEDIGFITLWIAFNACYGSDDQAESLGERASFTRFMTLLVELDTENRIYNSLWMNYSNFVKALVNNEFVYPPFWRSVRAGDNEWEASFEKSKKLAMSALSNNNTALLLEIILDRLYVLRNQLVHGGATYKSQVNRSQVKDGQRLLAELLPIIIPIMLDHDERDWGPICFPVVNR